MIHVSFCAKHYIIYTAPHLLTSLATNILKKMKGGGGGGGGKN